MFASVDRALDMDSLRKPLYRDQDDHTSRRVISRYIRISLLISCVMLGYYFWLARGIIASTILIASYPDYLELSDSSEYASVSCACANIPVVENIFETMNITWEVPECLLLVMKEAEEWIVVTYPYHANHHGSNTSCVNDVSADQLPVTEAIRDTMFDLLVNKTMDVYLSEMEP